MTPVLLVQVGFERGEVHENFFFPPCWITASGTIVSSERRKILYDIVGRPSPHKENITTTTIISHNNNNNDNDDKVRTYRRDMYIFIFFFVSSYFFFPLFWS